MVEYNKVIVIGDFNIDISKDSYYANKLIKTMQSYGYKQHIKDYTRITNVSRTLIDLVFSNFKIITRVKHTPKITDHSILVVSIESVNKDNHVQTRTVRDFTNFNDENFIAEIKGQLQKKEVVKKSYRE